MHGGTCCRECGDGALENSPYHTHQLRHTFLTEFRTPCHKAGTCLFVAWRNFDEFIAIKGEEIFHCYEIWKQLHFYILTELTGIKCILHAI